MEDEESGRPAIGFPLGLALLLFTLFLMTGLFTCCLHWDKLRSLIGIPENDEENSRVRDDSQQQPHKTPSPRKELKTKQAQSLPVLMPGEQVPRFVAIYCPCQPPALEEIKVIKVQKPHPFPVPLY